MGDFKMVLKENCAIFFATLLLSHCSRLQSNCAAMFPISNACGFAILPSVVTLGTFNKSAISTKYVSCFLFL